MAASRVHGSPSPPPISLPINSSNPISLSPSFLFHLSPCPIKIPRTSYPYPPKTFKSLTSLRFLEKQTETREPYFTIHLFQRHKANGKKINRRKSPKEAASHQGSSSHGRINILERAGNPFLAIGAIVKGQ